ncbi:MAG: hypothetical protein H7318_09325 [Oligoflexus sp.]|nr:hypothetical protein [Oligoflexus sp.]
MKSYQNNLWALLSVSGLWATPSIAQDRLIPEACDSLNALSTCLSPKDQFLSPEAETGKSRYVADSIRYFLTMKSDQSESARIATDSSEEVLSYKRPLEKKEWNSVNRLLDKYTLHPHYSPRVIRFELPPWLLTTGYGEKSMKNVDELLRLTPTDYKSIDCESFPVQPFGRCHVVFLYGRDDPKTAKDDRVECPIYEEFTFNDRGEMSFIEAWTDKSGYLPMPAEDHWAEQAGVSRVSTSVPGLGQASGFIDPFSPAFAAAARIFDQNYQSEFWTSAIHPIGPFTSMVEDVKGQLNGKPFPLAGIFNIWPAWTKRALKHVGKNVLDGCDPAPLAP